jgi:hypothetical protein
MVTITNVIFDVVDLFVPFDCYVFTEEKLIKNVFAALKINVYLLEIIFQQLVAVVLKR